MLNPNGVLFNDFVYVYTDEMFNVLVNGAVNNGLPTSTEPTPAYAPGTHTFALKEDVDPGQMFIKAPSQNNMIGGTEAKMEIFGKFTNADGTTVEYPDTSNLETPKYIDFKEIYDFKATQINGDKTTFWLARITQEGSGKDVYISNYSLKEGDTYELLGRDDSLVLDPATPQAEIPTSHPGYQSEYDFGVYVEPIRDSDGKIIKDDRKPGQVQGETGMRIEDSYSPNSPSEQEDSIGEVKGYTDYVAYTNANIEFSPKDDDKDPINDQYYTIDKDVVLGVFRVYDNDDYFSDGTGDYTALWNDQTQLGQFYLEGPNGELVPQWNDGKPTLFQAEQIIASQDQNSDFFQFIQINWYDYAAKSEMTGDEQLLKTIWVSTSGREVIRDPVTLEKLEVNFIPTPGETYGWLAADGSPGYINPRLPTGEEQYGRYSKVAVCFTSGTRIKTTYGEACVEDLVPGDEVLTRDNGYQTIRWIGSRQVSEKELESQPGLRPVRIRAGSLGPNVPEQDLVVSQQHRILVSSKIAERMFGSREVLIPAKNLLAMKGVDLVESAEEVTYIHFLCDRHEVVVANGVLTESLYTGPEALKAVSPEARTEILTLFPELENMDYQPLPCRTLAGGGKAKRLAIRHNANKLPLISAEEDI